jgi:UDP-glucose 4-epimerase
MNILVTGGAGFIGSHIVDQLIAKGHQVIIIDNLVTGQTDLINPQAVFYQEDITNAEQVNKIIQQHQIQVICHQAAQLDVRKSVQDPQYDATVNIIGTINLFEAAHKNGVKKVVFASSGGAIYGDTDILPTPETHPTDPISPYGIAKLVMEKYAHYYKTIYNIDYTALRYSNVYGPRQNPEPPTGIITLFINKMLQNQQCYIYGTGNNTLDFVYVQDVVEANIQAILGDLSGIYNIGTSIQTTPNQIFDILHQLTNTTITRQHREANPGRQQHSCLSYDKIHQAINWQPQTNLQQGLLQTVEYFKSRQ